MSDFAIAKGDEFVRGKVWLYIPATTGYFSKFSAATWTRTVDIGLPSPLAEVALALRISTFRLVHGAVRCLILRALGCFRYTNQVCQC